MAGAIVVRFAFAILFDALAFVVWDIGTRPPDQLARDVTASLGSPRTIASGLIRFALGAALLVFAMLIAALIVEQLVGADLRKAIVGRGSLPR